MEAANTIGVRVSDFGFSSIWAGPDDVIQVPMTEPWNAPEWHHRGFTFEEARKMDIFSFGLLSIWVVMQAHELEPELQDIRSLLFTAQGDWKIDVLEDAKIDDSLVDTLTRTLARPGSTRIQEFSTLLEVFRRTLRSDVDVRDPSLSGVLSAFNGGFTDDNDQGRGTEPQCSPQDSCKVS